MKCSVNHKVQKYCSVMACILMWAAVERRHNTSDSALPALNNLPWELLGIQSLT